MHIKFSIGAKIKLFYKTLQFVDDFFHHAWYTIVKCKRKLAVMFGYVHILKEELKVKEYNVFRAYYCGLCKTLKKEYGFFARLGLNYDSVFLALLLSSITGDAVTCCGERCIANPVSKRPVIQTERCLSYSAGVMLILACLKIEDNIRDEKSIKDMASYILLWRTRRKLMKKHGTLYQECKSYIRTLSALEQKSCDSIDEVAHTFAELTEKLFVPDFIKDDTTKRILGHMGYLLGRFIYMLDAYEDVDKDKKKQCYNPYSVSNAKPTAESFISSMTFTLSTLANDYELLHIKCNKSILDNIIYLGLPNTLNRVAHGLPATEKGDKKHERSI